MSEDPSLYGLFPDTVKPPASVYFSHFSDKTGILSLLVGICSTPSIYSIKLST